MTLWLWYLFCSTFDSFNCLGTCYSKSEKQTITNLLYGLSRSSLLLNESDLTSSGSELSRWDLWRDIHLTCRRQQLIEIPIQALRPKIWWNGKSSSFFPFILTLSDRWKLKLPDDGSSWTCRTSRPLFWSYFGIGKLWLSWGEAVTGGAGRGAANSGSALMGCLVSWMADGK